MKEGRWGFKPPLSHPTFSSLFFLREKTWKCSYHMNFQFSMCHLAQIRPTTRLWISWIFLPKVQLSMKCIKFCCRLCQGIGKISKCPIISEQYIVPPGIGVRSISYQRNGNNANEIWVSHNRYPDLNPAPPRTQPLAAGQFDQASSLWTWSYLVMFRFIKSPLRKNMIG